MISTLIFLSILFFVFTSFVIDYGGYHDTEGRNGSPMELPDVLIIHLPVILFQFRIFFLLPFSNSIAIKKVWLEKGENEHNRVFAFFAEICFWRTDFSSYFGRALLIFWIAFLDEFMFCLSISHLIWDLFACLASSFSELQNQVLTSAFWTSRYGSLAFSISCLEKVCFAKKLLKSWRC